MLVRVRLWVVRPKRGHEGTVPGGNLSRELNTVWESHGRAPLVDPELKPIRRRVDGRLVAAVLDQFFKQVDIAEMAAAVDHVVAHVTDGTGADESVTVGHETVHHAVAHGPAVATRLVSLVGSPTRLVHMRALCRRKRAKLVLRTSFLS